MEGTSNLGNPATVRESSRLAARIRGTEDRAVQYDLIADYVDEHEDALQDIRRLVPSLANRYDLSVDRMPMPFNSDRVAAFNGHVAGIRQRLADGNVAGAMSNIENLLGSQERWVSRLSDPTWHPELPAEIRSRGLRTAQSNVSTLNGLRP